MVSRLSTLSRDSFGSLMSIDTTTSLISNESLHIITSSRVNSFHRIDSFTLYIFSNNSLRLELTTSAWVSFSASFYSSHMLPFSNQQEIHSENQHFEKGVIRYNLFHIFEHTHNLLRLVHCPVHVLQQTQHTKIDGVTGIH